MPYSNMKDLPEHVQKLPDAKQRQWMHVFNSCAQDGKDESKCFAVANGVVKKEVVKALEGEPLVAHAVKEVYGPLTTDGATDEEIETATKDYQYVDSWEYESRKMSQEAADYNPAGGTTNKACSNCFFFVSPARCTVVMGTIAPNGVSNQWRAVPAAVEPSPIPVIIVDKMAKEVDPVEKAATGIMAKIKSLLSGDKPSASSIDGRGCGIAIYKQKDGRMRWFSRYSNSWEDRDKEIIVEAAHKEYADWVTTTKAYPELWMWHTKGTRFGSADWVDFTDGFACASGLIDADKEYVVDYLKDKEVGVSHGFFSEQDGKYITKYRSFEISVLPRERAAVWTADFNIMGKETLMAGFTAEKRKFLVGAFGEEAVKSLEDGTAAVSSQLKELGIAYKAVGDDAAPATTEAAAAPADTSVAIGALAEVTNGLVSAVGDLAKIVGSSKKEVETLTETVKQLQKTDDERIAEAFASKAVSGAIARPTESTSNVTEKEATGELDFFGKALMGALGAAGAAAPTNTEAFAGVGQAAPNVAPVVN